MQYKEEYYLTSSKNEFIKFLYKKYKTKKSTAERRYYDLRKKLGTQTPRYSPEEKHKPNYMKLLMIKDMKEKKFKITREYLHKYGFTVLENNWLVEEGWIEQ